MSSLLWQALRSSETGNRKPVTCKLNTAHLKAIDAAVDQDVRVEFRLSATLSVDFWSTKRDYKYAERTAVKILNQKLYEGALTLTARMRHAVYSDEPEELLDLINQLEKEIGL